MRVVLNLRRAGRKPNDRSGASEIRKLTFIPPKSFSRCRAIAALHRVSADNSVRCATFSIGFRRSLPIDVARSVTAKAWLKGGGELLMLK